MSLKLMMLFASLFFQPPIVPRPDPVGVTGPTATVDGCDELRLKIQVTESAIVIQQITVIWTQAALDAIDPAFNPDEFVDAFYAWLASISELDRLVGLLRGYKTLYSFCGC